MFTPSRLALARRRRGLTKRKLAELIGVTERSIIGFETGNKAPGELSIQRMADALDFPVSFFSAPDLDEIPNDASSFRSLSKMTASQRNSALAAGILAVSLSDWIARRFRLPDPDIPSIGPGVPPEMAAEGVRAEWELGELSIPNMIHLLESHGVRVFSLAEDCREVDAFSFWRDDVPFVFLNTQKSAERSRMDAAHELGHLVLHANHEIVKGNRKAEQEAQKFASAFLMPRSAVIASAPRMPEMKQLMAYKRRWRVSLSGLIYRLYDVGLLTEWHYRSLNIEIGRSHYNQNEPHALPRETSQVLSKVFNSLRREGMGKADVAGELHMFESDLDAVVFGLAMLSMEGGAAGSAKPPNNGKLRLVGGTG